jgi:hypothetical protein
VVNWIMGKVDNLRLVRLAMLGLCGLGSMSAAFAAPPVTHRALDLHAPLTAMAALEKTSTAFPSSLHRQSLGSQEQIQLPSMRAPAAQTRIPGRIEEIAQRVHREGLPVARLWENKSALVSLGLNQKGKLGLWVIQKVR